MQVHYLEANARRRAARAPGSEVPRGRPRSRSSFLRGSTTAFAGGGPRNRRELLEVDPARRGRPRLRTAAVDVSVMRFSGWAERIVFSVT